MTNWRDKAWADKMALRLDFSNVMSDFVGESRGITGREIDELIPRASAIAAGIDSRKQSGELGFYQLPYDTQAAAAVTQMARDFQGRFDDFVVLGIGGSALGATALFRALCHPLHNLLTKSKRGGLPRVFVLDNIDPATIKAVLDFVKPEKTLFNVITKSGTTAETLSQFLIVRRMLEAEIGAKAAEHFVVTTGEGPLRELAGEAGYSLLSVPENVGGRFSILSPVGLFPAAMFGVDIEALLAGARNMDERCRTGQFRQNPAYLNGALHYLADTKKGLNIAVMMPYSDALFQVAFWFRQLWAESLGKSKSLSGESVNAGQTPVAALGVTDQHSQLQLYSEGPFNKLITFLMVENYGEKMHIPPQSQDKEWLAYLGGHTLEELIKIEAQSTQLALTKAGRSNISLILPQINAFTIGQLLFLLQVQTVFAGGLYNVNPLDQPGVESGKHFIQGMMGRRGFESKAREAQEWQNRGGRYII